MAASGGRQQFRTPSVGGEKSDVGGEKSDGGEEDDERGGDGCTVKMEIEREGRREMELG